MNKEVRVFEIETRIEQRDDKTVVIGHAAVFDKLSENLGGFREKIALGAFDEVLQDDVRALINHDSNLILGRTKAGTLRIGVDEVGLGYDYDDPATSYSTDLLKSLNRGDVTQSSFGFIVDKDEWDEDDEGRVTRTITKVKRLFDVSPVTFPAYPDTDVAKRSLEEFKKQEKKTTYRRDLRKKKMALR